MDVRSLLCSALCSPASAGSNQFRETFLSTLNGELYAVTVRYYTRERGM